MFAPTKEVGPRIRWSTVMALVVRLPFIKRAMGLLPFRPVHGSAVNVNVKKVPHGVFYARGKTVH